MRIPERKSPYQRAVERAKARGFDSPYAERKARAQAAGFTSPRTQREANRKARGQQRDYVQERIAAEGRARRRGFDSFAEEQRFKKAVKADPSIEQGQWQKAKSLAQFGITESTFNRMRTANKKWDAAESDQRTMTQYRKDIDSETKNFSSYRVGYIVTYYRANVDPKTNYRDSGKYFNKKTSKGGTKGARKLEYGYPYMDRLQYDLMVTYGDLSDTAWKSHYGPVLAV